MLELLMTKHSQVVPDVIGSHEPLRERFDESRLNSIEQWWLPYTLLWKSRRPRVDAFAFFGAPRKHDALYLSMGSKALPSAVAIASLVTDLSVLADADLAYAYIVTEEEAIIRGRNEYLNAFTVGMNDKDIRRGIPDLAWLTVFGTPYVEIIGRDRLLGTPGGQVREIDNKLVALQLTQDPSELANDFRAYDRKRQAAKEYLGWEFFWREGSVQTNKPKTPDWNRLLAVG